MLSEKKSHLNCYITKNILNNYNLLHGMLNKHNLSNIDKLVLNILEIIDNSITNSHKSELYTNTYFVIINELNNLDESVQKEMNILSSDNDSIAITNKAFNTICMILEELEAIYIMLCLEKDEKDNENIQSSLKHHK